MSKLRVFATMLIVTALGLIGQVATGPVANADPFDPGDQWVFLTNFAQGSGNQEEAFIGDQTNNTFQSAGFIDTAHMYEAIGYRVADNYIYGIHHETNTGYDYLVQISLTGTGVDVTTLGRPLNATGQPLTRVNNNQEFDAGTFGAGATADIMYLRTGEAASTALYLLDFGRLQTSTGDTCDVVSASCLPTWSMLTLATGPGNTMPDATTDMFYLDGYLWGVHQYNCPGSATQCGVGIYRFDVNNPGPGGVVAWNDYQLFQVAKDDYSEHGYGSQWVYTDGTFGISSNQSTKGNPAMIYRFSITEQNGDPYTGQGDPKFTLVWSGLGPLTDKINDGTSSGMGVDLAMDKSVQPATVRPGDQLHYTLKVTNQSTNPNAASSGWTVTDTIPAGVTIDPTSVHVTATPSTVVVSDSDCAVAAGVMTCHGGLLPAGGVVTITYIATVDKDAEGKIINTAIVKGREPDPDPEDNDDDAEADLANIRLTKTADPTRVYAAGETITYTFTIKNTGSIELTNVRLTEQTFTGKGTAPALVSCTVGGADVSLGGFALAPGATAICKSAAYTVTDEDMLLTEIKNTAVASGTPPGQDPITDSDDATVGIAPPAGITLVKTASPTTVSYAGDKISYTLTATNTGQIALNNVTVREVAATFTGHGTAPTVTDCTVDGVAVTNGAITLAPAKSVICKTTGYTVVAADLAQKTIWNEGTATGKTGDDRTVNDTASAEVAVKVPGITIKKEASPTTVSQVGDTIAYTFTITNSGDLPLTEVTVTETAFSGKGTRPEIKTCTVGGVAVANGSITLEPGETAICQAEAYTVVRADLDPGVTSITNTAVASGKPPHGEPVTDEDDATVTVPPETRVASIGLKKEADLSQTYAKTKVTVVGDKITYTLTATNTGTSPLTEVKITETAFSGKGTPAPVIDKCLMGTTEVTNGEIALAPGESVVCTTTTYTVTGADLLLDEITNTALATGLPARGPEVRGEASATVDVETPPDNGHPVLVVDKTADPVKVSAAGQSITYTFTITNTGSAPADGVKVVEKQFNGSGPAPAIASCTIAGVNVSVTGFTLPAKSVAICKSAPYKVSQMDIDSGHGLRNVAVATGKDGDDDVTSPEDDATVDIDRHPAVSVVKTVDKATASVGDKLTYTLTVTNTGNVTVSIKDFADVFTGKGPWAASVTKCTPESLALRLAPGQKLVCTMAPYTVVLADVGIMTVKNTVVVHATPAGGGDPVPSDPSSVTTKIKPLEVNTGGQVAQTQNMSGFLALLVAMLGAASLSGVLLRRSRRS